jgi:hypothetical protein
MPTWDFGRDAQADAPGEQFPDGHGVLGGFLDVPAHGEAQGPALRGQERDSFGDRFAGFAVGVFGQRADFVEFE